MPNGRNPDFEPREDRRYAGVVLAIVGATTAITTVALLRFDPLDIVDTGPQSYFDDIPDRYVTLLLPRDADAQRASEGTGERHRQPDAGEGQRASTGEGQTAKDERRPGGATAPSSGDPQMSGQLAEREAAQKTLLLEALMGTETVDGDLGAPGVFGEPGLGGLASRGSGLGGGGKSQGLGGIGTVGRGSGGGGYGHGSGSGYGGLGGRGHGHGGHPEKSAATTSARPARPPVAGPLFAPIEDFQMLEDDSMTDPRVDPWSTFGADVDTASWSYTRRSLAEGHLPKDDRVRVEEFVNAFQYSYVHPTTDAPFAVDMEAAPDPLRPGHTVLRVGIQGANPEAERPPARLTFLVDVSGSMRGDDRLGLAQDSLLWLVDHLGPEDSVALVTYAGASAVVLEPTPAWQRQTIRNAIRNLRSGGGTSMGEGMALAYSLADTSYVEGAENRVLVLSDGDANIGVSTPEELLDRVRAHAEGGITMSTLGFGMGNYRDDMMEQLANRGDGIYAYMDSREEARRVFGERLGGTLQTIAKDVKIQLQFDPDAVVAWRLVGYENRAIADEDFRNDQIDAGEIGADHQVTAIYDVVLRERLPVSQPVAKVRLRAKPPGPDRPAQEWNTSFPAGLVRPSWEVASRDLRAAWTLAQTADKLRGAELAVDVPWARLSTEAAALEDQGFPRAEEIRTQVDQAAVLSGGLATR